MTTPDKKNGDVSMFRCGQELSGSVVRIEHFGAFVRCSDTVTGLLLITEISKCPVRHPSAVLSVGQSVEVEVICVNVEEKKISLSIKRSF